MCEDCRAQNLERKRRQFDDAHREVRPIKKGGYASKSKKVYRDRFEAARKDLKQAIEWYARARERGWGESWLYERMKRDGWYATRYRKARAEARRMGVIF